MSDFFKNMWLQAHNAEAAFKAMRVPWFPVWGKFYRPDLSIEDNLVYTDRPQRCLPPWSGAPAVALWEGTLQQLMQAHKPDDYRRLILVDAGVGIPTQVERMAKSIDAQIVIIAGHVAVGRTVGLMELLYNTNRAMGIEIDITESGLRSRPSMRIEMLNHSVIHIPYIEESHTCPKGFKLEAYTPGPEKRKHKNGKYNKVDRKQVAKKRKQNRNKK